MKVTVCIGSSCHIKGSRQVVEALQNLINVGFCAHRDGFHADLGYGRFTLGLTWYEMLTGKSCETIRFSEFDIDVTEAQYAAAISAAHKAAVAYR